MHHPTRLHIATLHPNHRGPLTALALSLLASLAAFALTPTASANAESKVNSEQERWYVVEMQGARVGWMRSQESTTPTGAIASRSDFSITIKRGPVSLSIAINTLFEETPDGAPIRMTLTQKLGRIPVDKEYIFQGDHVLVTSKQGDRTTTRTEPAPKGDWLTPAAAARAFTAHIARGDKTFSIVSVDPSAGLAPVTSTFHVKGEVVIEAMGKRVPAIECVVEQSLTPGATSVMHYDRKGEPIVMRTDLGGLEVVVRESEKELALSEVEPSEMLLSTLVTPDKPIDQPRSIRKAAYTLRIADGAMPNLPATGAQRSKRLANGAVRVEIDLGKPARADAADLKDARYIGSSDMIDPTDPKIRAITREALAATPVDASPRAKAETLRRFVHSYINEKNLDVGYATASEVCRTREGDCTEHAALLAAMLRAVAIPSRVANGVIYVDGFVGKEHIFGYHAWAQALLPASTGGAVWTDFDATLPGDRRFDAAHIALSVSSMANGEITNAMAALAPVLGQLAINVDSVGK